MQFNDVMRNMIDAQETILQTVDNLYKDTKRLIQKVEDPNSTEKLKYVGKVSLMLCLVDTCDM